MPERYLLPELSVFYPCYNEEKNLEPLVQDTIKVLKKITPKWEIVLVEDGSQDQTKAVILELQKKYPNIKPVFHSQNRGYGAAFKSGLYACKYQWITFNDSDRQFDFSEIVKLIRKQKSSQADVVLGYRLQRVDPPIRTVIATLLKVWNYIWFGFHGVKDIDCAFKLFKKETIDRVGQLKTESAITTTELLIKIQRLGFKFAQVGVHHFPRRFGSQTGSSFKVMKKAAIDSINLWKALRQ